VGPLHNLSNKLLDSKPLWDINLCKSLRFVARFPLTVPFNKNNANKAPTGYKNPLEVSVRNFIKAYFSVNEKFGLQGNEFIKIRDIITFIHGNQSTQGIKLSTNMISKLKGRKLIFKLVPECDDTVRFANYIKNNFPYFDSDRFINPLL
jgi:hypothetical protein